MKKRFWILSLAFVFFSCSTNKKAISDFEQIFGAKNSSDLTNMVDYFEIQILDKNFDSNSLSNKYTKLTLDCSEKGAIELMKNQDLDFHKFKKTQMWNEVYSQVDSTWINEDGGLSLKLIYNSENGVLNNGMRGLPKKYVDNPNSLIIEALDWEYLNHRGAFMKALELVRKHNSFINEYYIKKTTVGDMDSRLFCDMLLKHNPDFSDYFIKRILIIELIYKYVS